MFLGEVRIDGTRLRSVPELIWSRSSDASCFVQRKRRVVIDHVQTLH
jgi:hypothetical protein